MRYLGGYAADMVGDQVWFIALSWAATRSGDARTAALVVAAGTVPRMLLLLSGGVIVDRLGALRVAQSAQVLRIGTMLAAVLVGMTDPHNVALLAVLAVVFGLGDAARLPAAAALPPSLLPTEDLPQGQGLVGTAGRVTSVISGPAAGMALAVGGFSTAAALNLVLCTVGLLAFLSLGRLGGGKEEHSSGPPGIKSKATVRAGLRYVVAQRPIGLLLLVVTIQNLALAGPLNLGVILRSKEEGWGPQALGILFGVFGATAALGSLTLVRFRPRRYLALAGLAWSAVNAGALAALGYVTGFGWAILAIGVMGIALGPAGALLFGLLQANTDKQYIGRVMSLTTFSAFGLAPLALVGFALLAEAVGTSRAFLIAGAAALLCCSAGASSPALRRLAIPDHAEGRE